MGKGEDVKEVGSASLGEAGCRTEVGVGGSRQGEQPGQGP